MKEMEKLNNIKKGLNIFIIVIFTLALIYFVISYITSTVSKSKKEESNLIDINNIDGYIVTSEEQMKENLPSNIVKDYYTFYSLQSASENYIEYLMKEKYEQTYKVLAKEMTSKYSKDEYVEYVKKLTESEFNTNREFAFVNSNNLKVAYKIADEKYIAETLLRDGKTLKIGIKLNNRDKTYEVFYLEYK